MSRSEEFATIAEIAVTKAREKYIENNHKGLILGHSLPELYDMAKGEMFELAEEMAEPNTDPVAAGREVDDIINYLMAMRFKLFAMESLESTGARG